MSSPKHSSAALRRARNRVATIAASTLIESGKLELPKIRASYTMLHAIGGARALAIAAGSREAQIYAAAFIALRFLHSSTKAEAIESAVNTALADGADPDLLAAAGCKAIGNEGLAFGATAALLEKARTDPFIMREARRFPPSLRQPVVTFLDARSSTARRDRLDLLHSAAIAAIDLAAAKKASGRDNLLSRMQLPKSAARILPGACGAIAGRPGHVFHRWADPQRLALLGDTTLVQRRQVEFVQAVSQLIFSHRGLDSQTVNAMLSWGVKNAVGLPSGRHGSRYVELTRWMVDSVDQRAPLRPRRRWSAKISTKSAIIAAASHREELRVLRRKFTPAPLPGDLGDERNDTWPKGADLGDEIGVRRLWSRAAIAAIGSALDNCLRDDRYGWQSRAASGACAIYAVMNAGGVIGAAALGRDMTGAIAILEARGPSNSSLTQDTGKKLRRWASGSASPVSVSTTLEPQLGLVDAAVE
jgi:hypothetical protein